MEFFAPAKINLTFGGEGPSGRRLSRNRKLVCPIALFDRLEIELREEDNLQFTCDDPALCADEDNLVVRAARLFCGDIGLEPHLRIALQKQIPHGADLRREQRRRNNPAASMPVRNASSTRDLVSLAAELGSDVPFFIYRATAVCRGRGEQVAPGSFSASVAAPLDQTSLRHSHAWAYQRWQGSREIPALHICRKNSRGVDWSTTWKASLRKICLPRVAKHWLLEQPGIAGALMSGSVRRFRGSPWKRRRDSGRAAFARTVRRKSLGLPLRNLCNEAIGYTPARSSSDSRPWSPRNVRPQCHAPHANASVVRVDAGDGVRNFVKRLKSKKSHFSSVFRVNPVCCVMTDGLPPDSTRNDR